MRLKRQPNPVTNHRWIHLAAIPIFCLLLVLVVIILMNMSGIVARFMARESANFMYVALALFLLIIVCTGVLLSLGIGAICIGEDLLRKRKSPLLRETPSTGGLSGLTDIMNSLDDSIGKLKKASQCLSDQTRLLAQISQIDQEDHTNDLEESDSRV
jgi:hypothetical protein